MSDIESDLSIAEKIEICDRIVDLFYKQNFGSTNKSDLETLMFMLFYKHRMNNGLELNDYYLSKELGITQARIRTLREKMLLKYSDVISTKWQEEFAKAVQYAKYDKKEHYVKMIIQDVNVMIEVRNYIEEHGWYDECSLNAKLLRIPLDCFIEICDSTSSDSFVFDNFTYSKIIEIAKENSEMRSFANDLSKDGLKQFLMSATKESVLAVLKILPLGGVANVAIKGLIKVLERE